MHFCTPWLLLLLRGFRFMEWVDARRTLAVLTNADTPDDAAEARKFGAQVRGGAFAGLGAPPGRPLCVGCVAHVWRERGGAGRGGRGQCRVWATRQTDRQTADASCCGGRAGAAQGVAWHGFTM